MGTLQGTLWVTMATGGTQTHLTPVASVADGTNAAVSCDQIHTLSVVEARARLALVDVHLTVSTCRERAGTSVVAWC